MLSQKIEYSYFNEKIDLEKLKNEDVKKENLVRHYFLCYILLKKSELMLAESHFSLIEKKFKHNEFNPWVQLFYLVRFFKLGCYQKCINMFMEIENEDHLFRNKWFNYEFISISFELGARVLPNLDDLIRKHQDFVPALLFKASFMNVTSEAKQIIALFKKYIITEKVSYNYNICNILAQSYFQMGLGEQALYWAKKSIDNTKNCDAFVNMALYYDYELDDDDKFYYYINKALALNDKCIFAYETLFDYCFENRNYGKIIEVIKSVKIKEIHDAELLLLNIAFLVRINEIEKAIDNLVNYGYILESELYNHVYNAIHNSGEMDTVLENNYLLEYYNNFLK